MINEFRTQLGLPSLTHSYNLSGQSKIWAMGLWRGVAPPKRAAVFSGAYGGESVDDGVMAMLSQRNVSGPGGVCMPGHDCRAWRVLMDRSASRIGCAALETDMAETIVVCSTDWVRSDEQEAVY